MPIESFSVRWLDMTATSWAITFLFLHVGKPTGNRPLVRGPLFGKHPRVLALFAGFPLFPALGLVAHALQISPDSL